MKSILVLVTIVVLLSFSINTVQSSTPARFPCSDDVLNKIQNQLSEGYPSHTFLFKFCSSTWKPAPPYHVEIIESVVSSQGNIYNFSSNFLANDEGIQEMYYDIPSTEEMIKLIDFIEKTPIYIEKIQEIPNPAREITYTYEYGLGIIGRDSGGYWWRDGVLFFGQIDRQTMKVSFGQSLDSVQDIGTITISELNLPEPKKRSSFQEDAQPIENNSTFILIVGIVIVILIFFFFHRKK